MGPLCNASDYAGAFVTSCARGAVASRPVPASGPVGIFVYWEWNGAVPIVTRSLASAVRHARGNAATCELAPRTAGSDVQLLRARRPLAAGDPITVDYWRMPWWIFLCWLFFWWWRVPAELDGPPLWRHGRSAIHGTGVLATQPLSVGTVVDVAIERRWCYMVPVVTRDFGRYINHSRNPSAQLVWCRRTWSWYLVTLVAVPRDGELTVDYDTLPAYCARPEGY